MFIIERGFFEVDSWIDIQLDIDYYFGVVEFST